jgi:hypothetical protein
VVGLVAGTSALVFSLARWAVADGHHLSRDVVAGRAYVDPRNAPPGLPVGSGSGYDGQFYYRIALDPLAFAHRAFGITLDSVARLGRIGYPALAWLLAAGHRSAVPAALVAVNVLALAALGWGGGLIAREAGRHPMWGLVLPAYFGYLWSLSRDLTEITAAAFLVAGLYAYRRERFLWAGLALLMAVLSKETAAYVVLLFGLVRLVPVVRRRRWSGLGRPDLPWIVPLVGFVGWQAMVAAGTGHVPVLASGGANLGAPMAGLASGLHDYGLHPFHASALVWWGELAVLVVLTASAGASWTRTGAPLRERAAWVAVVVLALCAARGIWNGDVGFRSLDAVWLFDWVVLLGSPRRLALLAAMSGVAWLAVAIELIRFV